MHNRCLYEIVKQARCIYRMGTQSIYSVDGRYAYTHNYAFTIGFELWNEHRNDLVFTLIRSSNLNSKTLLSHRDYTYAPDGRGGQVSGIVFHKETNHSDDHAQQQGENADDHNLAWHNRVIQLYV